MFLFRRHAYRVRADEVVEPTEDGDSLERDSNIMDEYEQDRRDVEDIVRPMLTEENSSVNSYVQVVGFGLCLLVGVYSCKILACDNRSHWGAV